MAVFPPFFKNPEMGYSPLNGRSQACTSQECKSLNNGHAFKYRLHTKGEREVAQ